MGRAMHARSSCRGTSTESSRTERFCRPKSHLDGCDYCRRRYRFEVSLRQYVQTTAVERMPVGLMEKLTQLRSADA